MKLTTNLRNSVTSNDELDITLDKVINWVRDCRDFADKLFGNAAEVVQANLREKSNTEIKEELITTMCNVTGILLDCPYFLIVTDDNNNPVTTCSLSPDQLLDIENIKAKYAAEFGSSYKIYVLSGKE